uniref:Non-structural protein 4 n=1 Tax=Hubei virga-like virus 4 TaxID=1923339 RepID=A0A1L3KK27_9VIRU|nr:hypothetical protein [Hubei virga-like virus 4]
MANLTHDVVNSLVSSLSAVLMRPTETVEKELYATAFKNSEVQNCVVSSLVSRATNSISRSKQPVIRIYQKLTSAQQLLLQDSYMNFNLDFERSYDTSPHAFARASRKCERRYLLHLLKISTSSVPINGYDVVVKDVGGKPVMNLNEGAVHFHACFPLLSNADDYRHSMFHHHLRTLNPHTLKPEQQKVYYNFIAGNTTALCHKKSQNCTIRAQSLMFLHSTYDMSPEDVAISMYRADALIAAGCFIFSPDVLINDSGYIDILDCYYKKFLKIVSGKKKIFIRFWFNNDFQDAYTHLYSNYVSMLYTRRVNYNGNSYFFQPQEIKNSVYFFLVTKSIYSTVPMSEVCTIMTIPSLQEKLVLYYYKWETLLVHFSEKKSLVPIRVVVHKKFFDNLYAYALTLPEGKFTVKNIMTAAMTFNTREVINGMTVNDSHRLSPDVVCYASHVVYFLVYVAQYELSRATGLLLEQESKIRRFRNKSLFMRFFSNFLNTLKPTSSPIHVPINSVDTPCNETTQIKTIIEKIYDYINSTAQPERTYDIFVSDYSCKFITIEQECGYITSDKIISTVNRGHFDHSLSELIDRKTLLSTITQAMDDETPQTITETSPFVTVDCQDKLEIVPNHSNGLCFYQSLIDAGVFNGTIDSLKLLLLNSNEIDLFPPSVRDIVENDEPPHCYATEEVMKLAAHFFNITICIHINGACLRYGTGELYHFSVENNHCQALVESYVVSPVIIYDIVSDMSPVTPEFPHFITFFEQYIRQQYIVLEKFTKTNYKKKYSTARRTVDAFVDYKTRAFDERVSLQLCELFSLVLSGKTYSSSFMFSSRDGTSWYDQCLDSVKYLYIIGESNINYETVHQLPVTWTGEVDIQQIFQSLININQEPTDLTIFDLTFMQPYELPLFPLSFEETLSKFIGVANASVQFTKTGGDSVILVPFVFSPTFYESVKMLVSKFESVRMVRLLCSRFDGFEIAIICQNRSDRVITEVMDTYLDVVDSFCNRFIYCSKIFSKHILNAGTKFEVTVTHPKVFANYFTKMLDTQLQSTVNVNKPLKIQTPVGDCHFYDSNLLSSSAPTYLRRSKNVKTQNKISSHVSVTIQGESSGIARSPARKKPTSSSSSLSLSKYSADYCSQWSDTPLGITDPPPFVFVPDNPMKIITDTPLNKENLNNDESKALQRMTPSEPTDNSSETSPIVDFLCQAADEYLRYLEFTIQCDYSLVKTFVERVIRMAVFSKEAVMSFPSSFFLYSKSGTIAGEPHKFTHYYNSDLDIIKYDAEAELVSPFLIDGLPPFVIVNEFCNYGYLPEELRQLKQHSLELTNVKIEMLQAGPGTGKTTFIINNHSVCTSSQPSTVILSTCEGRDDFRRRVKQKFSITSEYLLKKYYRTAASYLLNHNKNVRTASLYIDEALMHHAGALAYLISLSGCSIVTLIGDKNQIPFVNRTPDFRCQYSAISEVISSSKNLNISFRCPLDIVYRISDTYPGGLFAANKITSSIYYKKISSLIDVPRVPTSQYIVFTQAEKTALAELNLKVATVHEFQGKEADHVIIVRINPYIQDEIFNSKTYVLVAITRHRKSCVYYTKVTSDLISKTIGVDRVLKHELVPINTMLKHYKISVGSTVVDYVIDPVCPNSYFSISNVSVFYKKIYFPSSSRSSVHDNTVHITRNTFCSCRLNHFIMTMDFIGSLKNLRAYFKNNIHSIVPLLSYKYHVIDYSDFCSVSTEYLFIIFYKSLKTKGLFFSDSESFATPASVFENLNINACATVRTHQIQSTVLHDLWQDITLPSLIEPVVELSAVDFLSTAQTILDERFGDTNMADQSYDEYMIMTNDLEFGTGKYRFCKIRGMYSHPHFGTMQPVLKTVVYRNRNLNYREILLALEKRNFSAPKLAGVVDYEELSTHLVENMFSRCIDEDNFRVSLLTPIEYCQTSVAEWLEGQKPEVVNMIVPDFALHLSSIDTYNFSIKRKPKPSLECDANSTYAALQTILYHPKSVNAVFCAIFKQIKSKLLFSLKPNCFIYADMSPSQLADTLTRNLSGQLLPFSIFSGDDSIIFDGQHFTEIDISKYDKSQNLLALLIDCKLLRKFQVPEFFINLWFNCHFLTYIYDKNIKLRAKIPFQRKSGDASTFLFNTTFAMCVIANEIPLDNLHSFNLPDFRKKNISIFPLLYNLEVKIFSFKYAYFCSKFLLYSEQRKKFYFIPDPLKLLVKLGRSDLINFQHVECYRVSMKDSVSVGYHDLHIATLLSTAVNDRYSMTSFSPEFMKSFYLISDSKAMFSSLYYINENHPVNNRIQYFSPDYFYRD